MSDIVEWLRDRAFKKTGPTMEAVHTKQQEWIYAYEIERLRKALDNAEETRETYKEMSIRETVENARLRAENARLRAALKPFAELWSIGLIAFGTEAPDDYTFRQSVSCGIVRAAAAALKETGE